MARRKDRTAPPGVMRGYAFAWVTVGFFLVSLVGHWTAGWFAFVNEQRAHDEPVQVSQYVEMTRDTLENWQSEFLQLLWQVAGLAFLLYVGSPQSKEGSERVEAKLDEVLRAVNKEQADRQARPGIPPHQRINPGPPGRSATENLPSVLKHYWTCALE
jgi:hypothetical protein